MSSIHAEMGVWRRHLKKCREAETETPEDHEGLP